MQLYTSAGIGYKTCLIVILETISFVFAAFIPSLSSTSLTQSSPPPVEFSPARRNGGYPHFWVELSFKDRPSNEGMEKEKNEKLAATRAVQAFLNRAAPDLGFSTLTIDKPVQGYPVSDEQGNLHFTITMITDPTREEFEVSYEGLINTSSSVINGQLSRSDKVVVKVVNGKVEEDIPARTSNGNGKNVKFSVNPDRVTYRPDVPTKELRSPPRRPSLLTSLSGWTECYISQSARVNNLNPDFQPLQAHFLCMDKHALFSSRKTVCALRWHSE
ncbi:hypothetical protein F5050DRAFT_1762069 [Lentinula boryana]|uniref:Uncharacterized protein n=1 Tax=Lentinula boryana TaxID=40481 RepID=A0ABQ8QC42_9AGAR|nr:hypothetical protein F5050DRAFT_1762069 [Lentinula boryana]